MITLRIQDAHRQVTSPQGKTVSALNGVNLDLNSGEILALMGPPGAGKTTLLKTIAGMEKLDQGALFFEGHDLTQTETPGLPIGLIISGYAYYPQDTSRSGSSSWLRRVFCSGSTSEQREQRLQSLAALFETDAYRIQQEGIRTVSSPEEVRLAIARCLWLRPRVMLFDDPFADWDIRSRQTVRKALKEWLQREAIATLYVSQDQRDGSFLGTRVAIMDQGQIAQTGTLDELIDDPVSVSVARYIGTPPMNVLSVMGRENKVLLIAGSKAYLVPCPQKFYRSGDFFLGVAPDKLTLSLKHTHGAIQGTVKYVEHPGPETSVVYCAVGSEMHLSVRDNFDLVPEPDDPVWLSWQEKSVLAFHGKTGARL